MTLLTATGLRKSYGAARVVDNVDFELRGGEIHALAGENGAGKSTLIRILSGAVRPDSGEIRLRDRPLPAGDPHALRRAGISVVYQELTLVPELTVAENVFLGREHGRLWLRRAEMTRTVQRLLAELGVEVPASARVRGLSVAHQQMVEIARALSVADASVLILDEPTASLSSGDTAKLVAVLRRLREAGLGIVYISHRLEEIFELADRVTVMRDGRHVVTADARAMGRAALIRAMVGRDVSEEFPPRRVTRGREVLDVRGLSAPMRFHDVSLNVHEGEIVALAGLVGSGRTSVGLALAGAIPFRGEVRLGGARVAFRSPAQAIAAGLAYVTEDRKAHGIFPALGVSANITMTYLRRFARGGIVRTALERVAAAESMRRFDVRAASPAQPATTLSGGNQQKMLLARFLLERRRLIVLDEPTRGVDVGARAEIYRLMNDLTGEGLAILMISSELTEAIGMSDRIVVMREGRTAGQMTAAEATPERVMELATPAAARRSA